MQAQSPANNSNIWKICHSISTVSGSITFFIGSLFMLPYFQTMYTDTIRNQISTRLFRTGSLAFILAELIEWSHYQPKIVCDNKSKFCQYPTQSAISFLSLIGRIVYLIAAILFVGQNNKFNFTSQLHCFIIGSTIVLFAQSWKIGLRTYEASRINKYQILKTVVQLDCTGFLVDLFAWCGALFYYIGSFIFFNTDHVSKNVASILYILGACLFYCSGTFLIKKYFINSKKMAKNGSVQVNTTQTRVLTKDTL